MWRNEEGQLWQAMVKPTTDRTDICLVTLHRGNVKQLEKSERESPEIKRE